MCSSGRTLEELAIEDELGNKKWVYVCSCGGFPTQCGHWDTERETENAT